MEKETLSSTVTACSDTATDDLDLVIGNNASAEVKDDGRVDIEISTDLSRRITKILDTGGIEVPEIASPAYRWTEKWTVPLNILIQVIGSRGDIQPFVALGNELQQHGHRVRLATHNIFADFVRSSGLEFFPVGGDPSELMAYMVKNPGLIPSIESIRSGDIQSKRRMVSTMLDGFWSSCIQPDQTTGRPFVAEAIIANPPSFAHIHCAQALGIPLHMMFTMPWTSTTAFRHPLANLKFSGNSKEQDTANFLSYGIVEFMTWQGLGDLVNQWREKVLGLEPVHLTDAPSLLKQLEVPFTYCWSPSLIPKPKDWGSNIDVCGFFFRDPPAYTPPSDLEKFLKAGSSTPIYIGFGSIVVGDPDRLMTMVIKAVKTLGVRAIISKGWSKLTAAENDPNIFFIGDCPHEWLFQHVSVVVHHGGAGTTACGLRYAKPTVIIPFFGDQPFWGEMVAQSGAGPKPIPYSELTSRNLAEGISYALDAHTSGCAEWIAEKLQAESGVKAAVGHFHSNLPLNSLRCDLNPSEPAAWSYKGAHQTVRLSKRTERILTREKKLDPKKLKL
ncbi:hypothetical protein F4810DRAFT_696485 [Camillea tinctor]|nr:hypothetical protein F4810DRAFT_696485 [Camillea tinctor]